MNKAQRQDGDAPGGGRRLGRRLPRLQGIYYNLM